MYWGDVLGDFPKTATVAHGMNNAVGHELVRRPSHEGKSARAIIDLQKYNSKAIVEFGGRYASTSPLWLYLSVRSYELSVENVSD